MSRRQTELDAPHGRGAWRNGWHAGARHVPSPNFSPRPEGMAIQLAVLHSISLPPGEYGGAQVEQLFVNQLDWSAHPYFERIRGIKVSAHFVIRRDGELLQFVSVQERAWQTSPACLYLRRSAKRRMRCEHAGCSRCCTSVRCAP